MTKSTKRSTEAQEYSKLYKRKRWQQLREEQLIEQPWCEYCARDGVGTLADAVDHVKPHKGDERLFYDKQNLQSLCFTCHNSTKQKEENGKRIIRFDENGFPI